MIMKIRNIINILTLLLLLVAAIPAAVAAPTDGRSARGDREQEFMRRLKGWPGTADDDWGVEMDNAVVYLDTLYMLPGQKYVVPQVSSNTFYFIDEEGYYVPLIDFDYPAESLANIFILPTEIGRHTTLDLTVLTHEYGTKAHMLTTVDKFVSLCQTDGCQVYYGVESLRDGRLECAVFLYNPSEGYDHVLRLTCDPDRVLDGEGTITGRLSLYVPTENVVNHFQSMPTSGSKAKQELDRQYENAIR